MSKKLKTRNAIKRRDDDIEKQDKIIKRIAKEVFIDKPNN
jgi:hypothetical protein